MAANHLSELLKLSEAERIQLAQDLWDSIPEKTDAPRRSEPVESSEILEDVGRAEEQIERGEAVEHEEARRHVLERLSR